MGGGKYDNATYHSAKAARAAKGIDDFAYTKTAHHVHENLDPRRINKKPFGKLESRDSAEHPESNAVLVSFDVTGSNKTRAIDAQKALPKLMDMLGESLPDVQVAFAANDDYKVEGRNAVQVSDFESDIRIDEHLRNIWLIGDGGGNDGESYDLILYAAARKTVLDCYEKRGKRGYLFLYADEPFFQSIDRREVQDVFGDAIEKDIPIQEMVKEVKATYNTFIIWPRGGYQHALEQYKHLFGEDHVLELQHANLICELIGGTVQAYEKYLKSSGTGVVRKPSIALPASSGELATMVSYKGKC